ncbi:cytidylate kinase-like family protein [Akkermansia massiliensis]
MIAERLGLQFYDSELVYLTASQSGLTPDYIRKHEQQLSSRFLHELYAQNYAYTAEELPPEDATFLAQSKVIRDITARQACVIVGRCANFILKGRPNLFSVFLHADRATRMQRVTENYEVKPGGAAKAMDLMDSRRRTHCLHYTGQELGNARLYDLCVNTSDYGLERTVELILEAINTRTEQSPAAETAPVREPALPEPEAEDIQGEISLA